MTPEAKAGHPKVLIISQGAPGIGTDANCVMLWRLLKYFPANSYMVLSSARDWPDGSVPSAKQEVGYRCFASPVVRGMAGTWGEGAPGEVRSRHLALQDLKDWLGRSRPGRSLKSLLHQVRDFAFLVRQLRSAAKAATSIAENEGITRILATSDDGTSFMVAWIAHRRTGIPLDLFVFDLWRGNVFSWSRQTLALLFQRPIFAASRQVFSAGDGIGEYLDKRLRIRSIVVRNSVGGDDEARVTPRPTSGLPMTVLYTGNIYWAQIDALLDMIAAVRDMAGIEFHIYSHGPQDELRAMGVTGNNVVLHQGVAEEEVRRCQAAADVLYLPMSFGNKGRLIIETAQPAKSVEYMASGVPVLVHAPAYAFVARYAREHDIAVVVDQQGPDELRRVLTALMSDSTDARSKAARAAELANSGYNSVEISHLMQSYLLPDRGAGGCS